jgi:hypothetical protein
VKVRRVIIDGLDLRNVHARELCRGRNCVVHNQSEHHMRSWRLFWRVDRRIFERLCEHGVGHPDPDQFDYWREIGTEYESVHGCDGCCVNEESNDDLHAW